MKLEESDPTRQADAPGLVQYWLKIQPETPSQPWHATLKLLGRPGLAELGHYEFDSPLELARYLASLASPQPKGTLR